MKGSIDKLILTYLIWIVAPVIVLVGLTDISLKIIEVLEMKSEFVFPYWDSTSALYKLQVILGLMLGLLFAYFHQRINKYTTKIESLAQRFIRVWLAFMISSYGFAKVLKTQFQVPEHIKSIPMGEQHPFWLTWNYFGFSREYALILASVEIAGAILLLFNRTKLIGACILLPALINILLINKFYFISPLAFQASFFFTLGILYLILVDYEKIRTCFLDYVPALVPSDQLVKNILRILVIGASYGLIWLYADVAQPNPSNLRGVWVVESIKYNQSPVIRPNARDSVLTKMYFEYQPEGETILEFNDYFRKIYTGYSLNSAKDSLFIQLDKNTINLKIKNLSNANMLLSGFYLGDSITISLARIKDISR